MAVPSSRNYGKADRVQGVPSSVFTALFDNAAVGMARVDTDGRWLSVNDKLCSMFGYTEEELGRLTFQDLTYPDDLNTDLQLLAETVAGKRNSYTMEKRYIRKDGSMFWAELHVGSCRDEAGAIIEFISVIVDIDDRKRSEQAKAEAEQRLRSILNGLVSMVGLIDPNGLLLEVNQRALDTGGVTRAEIIGRPIWETEWLGYDDAVKHRVRDAVRLAASGQTVRYDERAHLGDGKMIVIDLQFSPRMDDNGTVIEIIPSATDISDRYTAAERQNLLMRELNHRLKNQLAIIQAMAHHTAKRSLDVESFNESFAGRLSALAISQDLVIGQEEDRQPATIVGLIDAVVGPHVPRPGALLTEGSEIPLSRELSQSCGLILHELTTNALKYGAFSVPGGVVTINWHVEEQELALGWSEAGLTERVSAKAERKGFGHRLISMLCKDTRFSYGPDGLHAELRIAIPDMPVH